LRVNIGATLPKMETATAATAKPRSRKPRRFRRWLALGVVMMVGALVWLNGPGLRWLAPMAAAHFAGKAGARVSFTLDGSLTGGVIVRDLHLAGFKSLADLTVRRVTPVYQIAELARGRLQGIGIDGLHADLRLGEEDAKQDSGETADAKPPFDAEQLARAVRSARGRVIPLEIDLSDISVNATRDGKPVFALASSHLHHGAGDSSINLRLGAITDANGREWPAQESMIDWSADELRIGRLDPLPGVSIRGLALRLPENDGPAAETELRIDDAVFAITATPGFASITVDLREGHLHSDQVAGHFALKLPVKAELTSFSAHVEDLLPDPKAATGAIRLLLENVVAGEWTLPELGCGVDLDADRCALTTSGRMLGTGFSLSAEAPVTRGGGWLAGDVRGNLKVADVPNLIAALAERFQAIDPEATVPPSMLDGDFTLTLKDLRPASAKANLTLMPADPKTDSPIALSGRWQPGQPLAAELVIDGLKASATYQLDTATYQGKIGCGNFVSTRIDRWLAIVKVKTGGTVGLSGSWHGGGGVKSGRHHGVLALARAEWSRADVPPVTAEGGLDYDWPGGLVAKDLRIQANDQTISADAALAAGMLELKNLRWQDRGNEIAGGSASVPVPEDFAKWRETLARDTRPVEVSIESKVLSLALLKDWLPAAAKLDARSTGRLQLKVAGSYASPAADLRLEVKDLRAPQQPKLPPADLLVTVAARDGRLKLEGTATAPDYPAAVMLAEMPFRPAEWAEHPEMITGEKLTARIDLPRIDLSRYASLVAAARKISGFVTGHVEVSGELGKPVFKGKLDLTGGGFEAKDPSRPAMTDAGASVDLAQERVTLKNLKATVAGGTLLGSGSLAINAGKPGMLDIRLRGSHLPVMRNDSLIVRANADLRLAGAWPRAALSGTVDVVDSLFYRDIELLPIGTPFTTPSAAALPKIDAPSNPSAAMPDPFRNWNLNVLVRTGNPFLIRGNFATGKVDGSVRIGGTLGNPAPEGEVRIADFRAALPFSTLTIRAGTARFHPATGFDPVLEIRGTAEPRPYQVNAYVYGRASNPQIALTSSPPLPDNEIMTLLATGTTTSGLENPQNASSRAMQLLAEELRRGRFAVGKRLRPLLSMLDRVDFSLAEADPYSDTSYSTATLAITDRWFLSAGMGADGDSRVMGIWRITFH
jgi:hypothetical protein